MDRKKIRNSLEYFWMYYKWPVMAAAVILSLGIYFLSVSLCKKETALSVMLLDCHTEVSQEQMEEDILAVLGLDAQDYQAEVQNSLMLADTTSGNYAMTSLSRFLADIGSEKLDVCAMLEEDFRKYEKAETFLDLRQCFSDEALSYMKDALVMTQDGRVVGLYADALPVLRDEYGCYESGSNESGSNESGSNESGSNESGSRGVVGIIYNTSRPEAAAAYLKYLAGPEYPEG